MQAENPGTPGLHRSRGDPALNLEQKIYRKLLEVPRGKVTTYGELARAVGLKNGQRYVGNVMNRNRYPGIVPCHRVVMSTGRVGGYAYGEDAKKGMLEKEGVRIKGDRILDWEDRIHRF